MALWFKCLLVFLELSFVLSTVIVLKLEDEEDIQKITAIIESKVDKQRQELEQLKNITKAQDSTINLLNSTFQDVLDYQQNEINRLTEENRELKSEINQTAEDLKQLKIFVTAQFYDLNSTFNDGFNVQQGKIKQLDDQTAGLKQDIQIILESAKEGTVHILCI